MRERLRLAAWNCAGRFHKKARILDAHAPDILVLSETPEDCVSNLGGGASGVWAGAHPGYGLAVLGMNGWKIEKVDIVVEEQIFLPVRASRGPEEQFLIGVCVKKDGDYVGPTFRALTTLSPFISEAGAILAGDFNQSVKFDLRRSPDRHFRRVLNLMDRLGLVSAWHHRLNENFGLEETPTYFHQWRENNAFHIDYVFVPDRIGISAVTLGTYEEFVAAGVSDHVPLIVDLMAATT